ncbi:ATP synthase F1 subunit gamma [Symbiobacterium terraclitae]|uniref:ATP synthase F1 subunit gamma n=1 Tax=Symbiobacterium terraclitae TaxID=557451 RepID=UPI0035B5567C
MAENKKAVLRRIKAVKSTQQITKAMKMVDAAKLRRAQEKVLAARPYARELAKTLGRLVAAGAGANHPLLARQPEGAPTVAYVVITADRGLAGSFNINVIRKAHQAIQAESRPVKLICIGRKGRDYFVKRKIQPVMEWVGLGDNMTFALARSIVTKLVDLYLNGEVDEVRLVYTEFINAVSQRPVEAQLLPVQPAKGAEAHGQAEYIYEPSPEEVLNTLVPRFAETIFYQALLESKASEHGARMTAMGNATDNAEEMIAKLTLAYNRARQAAITREISEIVGGANALKG